MSLTSIPLITISRKKLIPLSEIAERGRLNRTSGIGLRDGIAHLRDRILSVKAHERVALLMDVSYEAMMAEIERDFQGKGIETRSVFLTEGYDPAAPPGEVKSSFLDPEWPVMVIGTRENIWHLPERRHAKKVMKKRLVNLIHPALEFVPSLLTEPARNEEVGKWLDDVLRKGKEWKLTAPSGTDLVGEFPDEETGFFFERGDYSQGGKGGDFPSGEIGFGPKELSIEGTIALDLKIQHVESLDAPVRISVTDDRVKVLSEDARSRSYAKLIGRNPVLELISEVSFGMNPDWSTSRDPRSIVEEKNLGTAHFGHGGNWSYGKRTGPHFDAVILQPSLIIDDRLILSEGKPVDLAQERQ